MSRRTDRRRFHVSSQAESAMCVNRFGGLLHSERVVRCLEPANNALQSVCVVMLCYGSVLLCLSSLLLFLSFPKSGPHSRRSEGTLSLPLSSLRVTGSRCIAPPTETRPQYEFTFVARPVACGLFQRACIYQPLPQASAASNEFLP